MKFEKWIKFKNEWNSKMNEIQKMDNNQEMNEIQKMNENENRSKIS